MNDGAPRDRSKERPTSAGTSASTSTSTSTSTSVRAGLAIVAACTTALVVYAILRVGQKILFPEPDPALVLWSEHAGYFWRAWTAVYVGGMGGFVAYVASARHAARTARLLASAIVAGALLIAAQGVLVP